MKHTLLQREKAAKSAALAKTLALTGQIGSGQCGLAKCHAGEVRAMLKIKYGNNIFVM